MKSSTWRLTAAAFAAALFAPPAGAGSFVNEEMGYRISLPRDFEKRETAQVVVDGVAVDSSLFGDGPYVLDRFVCQDELFPKEYSWTAYHREIRTFFFPERTAAEIAAAREEKQRETATAGRTTLTTGGEIYLSFEEYAKARIRGFFFEEEQKATVAGFDARVFEMKFEKLARVPQRWVACSYEVPQGEFAILMTCTEQHYRDYKNEASKTFSSFRILDGGLTVKELHTTTELETDGVDESELTAEELLARREEQKREAYDECLESLESGWRSFETDHFLIAYACRPSYAREVAKHGEAVVEWLEETFGAIGSGHVQGMILRVYEQPEDVPNRWVITTNFGKGRVPTVPFARPDSRGMTSEFRSISLNVLQHWFSEKNDQLWLRMPGWLSAGLMEYVEDAELKGSRLRFDVDEWEKDSMVEARNAQERHEGSEASAPLKPLKLILSMPPDQLFAGRSDYARSQCSSFVRYLIEGPGKNNRKTGVVLTHYLGHLLELVDEVEKRIEKEEKEEKAQKKAMEHMTDEERLAAEDEAYRKRRERAYDQVAKELLDKAFERTFADWDDDDWRNLDASWMRYAEGRTR